MLIRFAVIITILEVALTAMASVLVTYTDPPPGFVTENDLRSLGMSFSAMTTAAASRATLLTTTPGRR